MASPPLRAAPVLFSCQWPARLMPVVLVPLLLAGSVVCLAARAGAEDLGASGPIQRPAQALAEAGLPAAAAPAGSSTDPVAAPRPAAGISLAHRRLILLELGRRTISLLEGRSVIGRWPVAIGDPATPTPTGTFQVLNKVVNPRYQSTRSGRLHPTIGPNGPLGDRWLGFHSQGPNQFGIHGTPPAWEWTVSARAAVSHGCVRMLTPHVRLLFDQVDVGTPVIVRR